MDYRQFLHELFDTKPDSTYINIWVLNTKLSHFTRDIDKAADYIDSLQTKKFDIYVSCGLYGVKLRKTMRGDKTKVIGIAGFYMDIDFLTSESKKKYPKNIKDVLTIVKGYGFDPSLIILTGNGCHCWWLFKEVWIFEDENERLLAESLNHRLQLTIKEKAAEKGWELDSTHDITRVMRIPGTQNCKNLHNIKDVTVYEANSIRYEDPKDFDDLLIQPEKITPTNPAPTQAQLNKILKDTDIDLNAEPPAEPLKDLLEIDDRFAATWDMNRGDMNDTSPSAYAMSLANTAALVEWEDHEIAALIVGFYKKHKINLKKLHRKKIVITIQKARDNAKAQKIEDYMENVAPVQGTKFESIVDPDGEKAKKATCMMLNLDIFKIVQYKQENTSSYRVFLKSGDRIYFKTAADFMSFPKWRTAVFEGVRQRLKLKKNQWEQCIINFAKFIIPVDGGSTTTESRMTSWLEMYLQEKRVIDIIESLDDNEPFVHEGHWWIYAQKFRNWVIQATGENKNVKDIELDFTVVNAERRRFTKIRPMDNKRKTIRPYKIPLDIIYPPPDKIKTPLPIDSKPMKADVVNFPKTQEGKR